MLYRTVDYAENEFDIFFYEHNLQGDVIAVYSKSGAKLASYTYDAWGNVSTTYTNGGASTGAYKKLKIILAREPRLSGDLKRSVFLLKQKFV